MKYKSIVFFLIFLVFCTNLVASSYPTEEDWIQKSINLTINTRFREAESLLKNKIADGDSTLEAYFYYASILNSKMTHFENQDDEAVFLSALQKVIAQTENELVAVNRADSSQTARLYFYRGSAYGYLAYFQGQSGKWYKAIDNGMKSVKYLNKAIELDSTLYDAYLGIGVYKYWRSTKLKAVLWLPFIPDSREEGIADIKKAINNSNHSRFMAMHQIIYILTDYGHHEEALPYAREVVAAYPESQFMWWAYAHTFFKMKKYPQAVDAYSRLLSLIENDPNANRNHWISCEVRIAEIYDRLGQQNECLEHCERVLAQGIDFPYSEASGKKIKQARNLRDKYRSQK